MWCEWSTPYRPGDDFIRPAQDEYRFPTIIQLDEVAPPPPSSQKALLSPISSSNQSYDCYSSSEECEEMEDDEDEEEATESYCSSDPPCPGFGMGDPERTPASTSAPMEQKVKMSRVLAWRNSFDSVLAEADEAAVLMSLKRKFSHESDDGANEEAQSHQGSDAVPASQTSSRSSKRSRTGSSSSSSSWSLPSPPPQMPQLPPEHAHMHICSACDASFLALEELQHHSESDHEACRIAVQYGFE